MLRPDPGQQILDQAIARATVEQRVAWAEERRRLGEQLVWQQVEVRAITDPVTQADFILRRLYPEMPDDWFESVVAKLAALHAAGRWHGFRRPE